MMKRRILSIALTLCMLLTVMPVAAFADEKPTWTWDSYTGTLTISGTGAMADYTVGNYNGSITSDDRPWKDLIGMIKKVVIEDGVTAIGKHAFRECKSLTNVDFSDSVSVIGEWAFLNCTSLTSVEIPGDIQNIGIQAFSNCTSLMSVDILGDVQNISWGAFNECTALKSVVIYGNVNNISEYAFAKCNNGLNMYIWGDIQSIAGGAFCSVMEFPDTPLDNVTIYSSKASVEEAFKAAGYSSFNFVTSNVSSESELRNKINLGFDTVTLTSDINLTSTLDLSDKTLTIDLNGQVLNGNINIADTSSSSKSEITLIDSNPTATHSDASLPAGGVLNGSITLTRNGGSKSVLNANGGSVMGTLNLYSYASKVYNSNNKTTTSFYGDVNAVVKNSEIRTGIYYKSLSQYFKSSAKGKLLTFCSDGKDYCYEVCANGATAVAPASPKKDGFTFEGWYTSQEGDTSFDFGNAVTEDITLYAQWKDTASPVFSGIVEGEKYCIEAKFKVTDNIGISSVEFESNGKTTTLTADEDGYYTIKPATGSGSNSGTVIAKDTSDNKATCGIYLKEHHVNNWKNDGTDYWQECDNCHKTGDKKPIPDISIKINGADKACRMSEYVFSFEIPDGCKDPGGYIDLNGKSPEKEPVCTVEGNVATITSPANVYGDAESFNAVAFVFLEDGYPIEVSKTVSIQNEHSGGTATCTAKAKCEACGEEYGEVNFANHDFTVRVKNSDTLKSAGTCQNKAVYYYTCSRCDEIEKSDIHTFEGELDSSKHTKALGAWQSNDDGHWKTYTCCPTVKALEGSHTYGWQFENGKYWQKCFECDYETAKKDIPEITINGADKVCVTEDYVFSFTLPEGSKNAQYGYSYEKVGSGSIPAEYKNGMYYGRVSASSYPEGEKTFRAFVIAETEDGFEYSVGKTVTIVFEHTDDNGDDKCDICGKNLILYGDVNGDGEVNPSDVVLLRRYFANYDSETGKSTIPIDRAADVNGDGEINPSDVVLLRRYFANYNSTTGESTIVLGK